MEKPRIKVLSEQVTNKIAAGEVVERPASVIKELVENSIDAGATQIRIEVVMGGRKSISIFDDGIGMDRENAKLCLQRHATSKIEDIEDVEGIHTLGFRGEAIAAIASVSRFTLLTRPHDEVEGTEVEVVDGTIQDIRDAGAAPGTVMHVRNLFHNIPVRRKFLKSEQTEMLHIKKMFHTYALAHHEISWTLISDNREVARYPGCDTLENRLADLYSADLLQKLRPLEYERSGLRITGFTGRPDEHRRDRSDQHVFINGRPASAPVIIRALSEAYRGLLPKERQPVVFMFIEVPPNEVDVNVHPMKKEVRFRNASRVRDAVMASIESALQRSFSSDQEAGVDIEIPVHQGNEESAGSSIPAAVPSAEYPIPSMPPVAKAPSHSVQAHMPLDEAKEDALLTSQTDEVKAPWKWCKVLGIANHGYAVLETDEGLVLMDIRSAHERVMYEQFQRDVVAHAIPVQGLLSPETVELNSSDAMLVTEHIELFKEMGFSIEPFGGDSFIVDALPEYLGNTAVSTLLPEIAHTLETSGRKGGRERWTMDGLIKAACQSAVNKSDKNSAQAVERLVVDLGACRMPYTDPRGRPTIIFWGFSELKRKFGKSS